MLYALASRFSIRTALTTLLVVLAFAATAGAQTMTLAWDANAEPDLAGYDVEYGTVAGSPSTTIDAGNVTSRQFTGLQFGVTYYFRVKAYNTSGQRSGPSSEVSHTPQSPTLYGLTVSRAGTGTGTVTSAPAGINCGADCTEAYGSSTVVTLTATPATGSSFTGWSGGGCTGTGACVVTMTQAQNVTATFTLSSTHADRHAGRHRHGHGDVAPAGINCGADCTEPYNSAPR